MIFFLGSSNWFSDALCVLADLVFFYVPMYMLGPRLEPILTALLILAHMVLPIVHGAAFYVVYSYYKTPRIILPADAGNVGDFLKLNHTPFYVATLSEFKTALGYVAYSSLLNRILHCKK